MTMIPEGCYITRYHWISMSLPNHDIVHFTHLMFHFSEGSLKLASESETRRSAFYPSSSLNSTFGFKIQDRKGRMHRFNCGIALSLFPFFFGGKKIAFPAFIEIMWVKFTFGSISETHSLADLIACIVQRVGDDIDKNNLPQILVIRLSQTMQIAPFSSLFK